MLTAETITDEQIRALPASCVFRDIALGVADSVETESSEEDENGDNTGARDPSECEIEQARARCAEIINAREARATSAAKEVW